MAVLHSAALLHGLQGGPTGQVPQIAVPPGLEKRQRAGLDLRFWELRDYELTQIDGIPVTTVMRTLADACRLLPRFQAVAYVDSALNSGLVGPADLDVVRGLMSRRRNCVAGRRLLAQARPGAQSPLETRVRLRATDGGFPPDAMQVPVLDPEGRVLGYGDMGFCLPEGGWLIVEADGRSVHELPEAVLHDRHRQNAFVAVPGNTVVRFTWADTRSAAYIPSVLRPMLRTADWRPGKYRRP